MSRVLPPVEHQLQFVYRCWAESRTGVLLVLLLRGEGRWKQWYALRKSPRTLYLFSRWVLFVLASLRHKGLHSSRTRTYYTVNVRSGYILLKHQRLSGISGGNKSQVWTQQMLAFALAFIDMFINITIE